MPWVLGRRSGTESIAARPPPHLTLEDLPGISGLKALRVTIASESKDESGEAVSRARPSAKEIERVLAEDKA